MASRLSLLRKAEDASPWSLSDCRACQGREKVKRLLADGIDPGFQKRRDKLAAKISADTTFKAVMQGFISDRRHALTPLYADQILRRLEADIFSSPGNRPIAEIDAPELLDTLRNATGGSFSWTTGTLTGTTGTDGQATVSVDTSGNIYIENRKSFAISVTGFFFSLF